MTSKVKQSGPSYGSDLLVAALAPATVLLFGALQMFFQNALEFPWFVLPVTVTLCLLSLAVTLVLFILLRAARRLPLLHQGLSVLFTATGVLLWVQGNFLVRQYGIFDGKEIDWSRFTRFANIDIALWAGGIVLVLALLRWSSRYAPRLAQIVLVIQLISTVFMAFAYEAPEYIRYEEDASRKFVFSKDSNVIFIVLDTFGADVFNKAIRPFPRYTDIFDGFTFYEDTMSKYPTTYASVTGILTGAEYFNQEPFQKFMKTAFLSESSLPLRLKQSGYDVYLPHASYTYASPETSSSVKMAPIPPAYTPGEIRSLLLATAFRYVPHQLKKTVFSRFQDSFAQGRHNRGDIDAEGETHSGQPADLAFLREFESTVRTDDSSAGTMKYYHLMGMHPPFRLNENLEVEAIAQTDSGIVRAARANMELVKRFLQGLRDCGIYDNSLVIVLADHGTLLPDNPPSFSYGSMAYLNPILFIKPPGAHGPLQFSTMPATLADLPATTLDVLNMALPAGTVSLLQNTVGGEHNALRHYYAYDWWAEGGWDKSFLPDMTEYVVRGSSLDVDNWQRTGTVYAAGRTITNVENPLAGPPVYTLDKSVAFGKLTLRKSYLLDGWGRLGVLELYPNEKKAQLLLRFDDKATEYLAFNCTATPLVADRSQRVVIRMNGRIIGQWQVTKEFQALTALVHRSYIKEHDDNILTFEFPDAFDAREEKRYEPLKGSVSVVLHGMLFARTRM